MDRNANRALAGRRLRGVAGGRELVTRSKVRDFRHRREKRRAQGPGTLEKAPDCRAAGWHGWCYIGRYRVFSTCTTFRDCAPRGRDHRERRPRARRTRAPGLCRQAARLRQDRQAHQVLLRRPGGPGRLGRPDGIQGPAYRAAGAHGGNAGRGARRAARGDPRSRKHFSAARRHSRPPDAPRHAPDLASPASQHTSVICRSGD